MSPRAHIDDCDSGIAVDDISVMKISILVIT